MLLVWKKIPQIPFMILLIIKIKIKDKNKINKIKTFHFYFILWNKLNKCKKNIKKIIFLCFRNKMNKWNEIK